MFTIPQYDTIQSNKNKIKKLDELSNLRKKRKEFFEKKQIYEAGVKDELLTKLNVLQELEPKKDLPEKTVTTTTDIAIPDEQLNDIAFNILKLNEKPKNISPTLNYEIDNYKDGVLYGFLNNTAVIINVKTKEIYAGIPPRNYIAVPLTKNLRDLLYGEGNFEESTLEDLENYKKIVTQTKASKQAAYFKKCEKEIKKRLPLASTESSLTETTSRASSITSESLETLPPVTFEQFQQDVKVYENRYEIEKQKLIKQNVPEHQTIYQAILNTNQFFTNQDDPLEKDYLDDLRNYMFDENKVLPDYVEKQSRVSPAFGEGIPVKFLPDNPTTLLKRLEILFTAKHHGHNSVFNEINAILKRLLEKKIITKDIYKKLTSNQRRA